jgi:uncharacterized lipoprotein YmbA
VRQASRKTAARRAAGALLVVVLAAGCLGRSPRPEFYNLTATAVGGTPVAALPELGIAVGALEFPRYLDRPEIMTRDGANRLVPAPAQRWGGSLRSEVQRVLADDLAALLGTPRVAVYPVEPRFPTAWRVLLDVRAFEGVPGESVVLRARWIVASAADGRAVAIEESVVERKPASASWSDYAAAHSEALGVLTREIAERIAALPAP